MLWGRSGQTQRSKPGGALIASGRPTHAPTAPPLKRGVSHCKDQGLWTRREPASQSFSLHFGARFLTINLKARFKWSKSRLWQRAFCRHFRRYFGYLYCFRGGPHPRFRSTSVGYWSKQKSGKLASREQSLEKGWRNHGTRLRECEGGSGARRRSRSWRSFSSPSLPLQAQSVPPLRTLASALRWASHPTTVDHSPPPPPLPPSLRLALSLAPSLPGSRSSRCVFPHSPPPIRVAAPEGMWTPRHGLERWTQPTQGLERYTSSGGIVHAGWRSRRMAKRSLTSGTLSPGRIELMLCSSPPKRLLGVP